MKIINNQASDGSCPSEANSGGWEGLGEDGWEPAPLLTIFLIISYHGIKNALLSYEQTQKEKSREVYLKRKIF
jgi:hypothetical protein